MRAERSKLLCAGEREDGNKKINCVRGSVRAERRKLMCAGERVDGKKKIIVCGGA